MAMPLVAGNAFTPSVVRLWVGEAIASDSEICARHREPIPPSLAAPTIFDDVRRALACVQRHYATHAMAAGIFRTRIAILPTTGSAGDPLHNR